MTLRRTGVILTACLVAIGWAAIASPTRAEERDDAARTLASPSGAVSMTVRLVAGSLHYSVSRGIRLVVQDSHLGMQRADAGFGSNLTLVSASAPITIDESYAMPSGKTSELSNHAAEQTLEFQNAAGKRIQLVFRAYDDGVAFRYRFPETSPLLYTVTDELTTFTIAANGRAVMQPYDPESLHEIFPTQDPPHDVGGWCVPALFDLGHSWVMLAESDLDGSSYAAQLDVGQTAREYRIKLPDNGYGTREPSGMLPWRMPWRAIIVGPDAASIVESNLVTHLAAPSRIADTSWIRPGRASWHWWSGGWVGDMGTLERFVDLAQFMGWEYSTVDADWDDYHSDQEMRGLVDYAAARGVGIFLWYNSAGPQNGYDFSPRDRMWDADIRRAEMAKLVSWGVKGIKVDFFNSDKQIMIQHYIGILEDAATYHLLVDFHGSTPPRGWSRTWPNMLSTEAVRGAEYYLENPDFPQAAPLHNVQVTFTRNVVGPMDYTPVTFSDGRYPHITTDAHELALSVAFESGIVHFADRDGSYRGQPQVVQDFLRAVPAAWDEIRFIEGDPASHVVLARRKGAEWYLAGLNGTDVPLAVSVDLTPFAYSGSGGSYIGDGTGPRTFSSGPVTGGELDITMAPFGGFVAQLPTTPGGVGDGGAGRPRVSIDRIQPNPFTGAARITYALREAGPVALTIHDAAGRRVRTLVSAARSAGEHVVTWDGADGAGAPVASGVYFCRLKAAGATASRQVLRLR